VNKEVFVVWSAGKGGQKVMNSSHGEGCFPDMNEGVSHQADKQKNGGVVGQERRRKA
jgi:hypothetical protein